MFSFLRTTLKRSRLLLLLLILLFCSTMAQALPDCSYSDELTPLDAYSDWPYTLVDTTWRLPADYAPHDLVSLTEAGFNDDRLIRAFVIPELAELRNAAITAGNPLEIQSAYRSYAYQQQTFQYWVDLEGEAAALASSARAGHSEHQLGTVLDFRSENGAAPWDLPDWAETPAGAWLKDNAVDYGFIMSYPPGQTAVTCYIYESWHYRYVGREVARLVHDSGLTLREWLWLQQPGQIH